MLMNSLSLDEEEAVQAELKALQQETVSSACLSSKEPRRQTLINHHAISYVPRATRKHHSHSQTHLQQYLYLQKKVSRLAFGQSPR
jgi:hypothetical protein